MTDQPGNSEYLNDADTQQPEYKTPEKSEKKGWSKKNKLLAIAGIAGAAIGVGSGSLALGLGKGKPVKNPNVATSVSPSASASIEASPTATPTPETSPSSVEMTALKFEQETTVEAMDAMSIEEFAKLSYADRAAYAYLKNPSLGTQSPEDEFNSADIPGFNWQQLMMVANLAADPTEGSKVVSALDYYVTKPDGTLYEGYQKIVDSLMDVGGSAAVATTIAYRDHGIAQSGVDRDGNEVVYTDITYQFTDIETGKPIGAERTSQVIEVEIKLDDNRTIMTYPRMFGIEGKKSPIEGRPY